MWKGFYYHDSKLRHTWYEPIQWLSAYNWVFQDRTGSGACLRLT